jgi:hypothetical protein
MQTSPHVVARETSRRRVGDWLSRARLDAVLERGDVPERLPKLWVNCR